MRLRDSLRECGVSPDKEARILKALMSGLRFMKGDRGLTENSYLLKLRPRLQETADLLGISYDRYREIAEKYPSHFFQSPAKLNDNANESARLLRISKAEFIKAAEIQPSLLGQAPQTIAHHAELIARLQQRGVLSAEIDLRATWKTRAALLSYGDDNIHLRYIYARTAGVKDASVGRIFQPTRKEIEGRVVAFYGHNANEDMIVRPAPRGAHLTADEKKHRALIALCDAGIIKSYKYQPVPSHNPL